MKYIYHNEQHPCNGMPCTIGWKFETSDNYMIYFDSDPRNIGHEIADMSQLEEV